MLHACTKCLKKTGTTKGNCLGKKMVSTRTFPSMLHRDGCMDWHLQEGLMCHNTILHHRFPSLPPGGSRTLLGIMITASWLHGLGNAEEGCEKDTFTKNKSVHQSGEQSVNMLLEYRIWFCFISAISKSHLPVYGENYWVWTCLILGKKAPSCACAFLRVRDHKSLAAPISPRPLLSSEHAVNGKPNSMFVLFVFFRHRAQPKLSLGGSTSSKSCIWHLLPLFSSNDFIHSVTIIEAFDTLSKKNIQLTKTVLWSAQARRS